MNAPTEKLVADVKVLTSDIEELLRATASQTGGKVAEARARALAAIANARTTAIEQSRHAARATDQYVRQNPWTAVGISAGVALLIGLLISRR